MVDKYQMPNPNGYLEEKHPQVYVNMQGSEEELPLLPSYSATSNHDMNGCTDEKQQQQPTRSHSRCSFRERWRARCARRCQNRDKCRAKCLVLHKILIFGILGFLLLYLVSDGDDWYNCGYNFKNKNADIATAPLSSLKALSEDVFASSQNECLKDLVPYSGPSKFTASVPNLAVKIGEGHLYANAVIRTGDVEEVTIEFKANVTQNIRETDNDDQDNDDDDNSDDEDEDQDHTEKHHKHHNHHKHRHHHKHGMHVDVSTSDESITVEIWADKYVRREDDAAFRHYTKGKKHHRHRHHHHHDRDHENDIHWRKFCGTIDLEITIPERYRTFGLLKLEGVVLETKTEGLQHLLINSLNLTSVVGSIGISPVRANYLEAAAVTGNVNVESVQVATEGYAINVKAASVAGNVKVNAKPALVDADGDAEAQTHYIEAAVVAGSAEATIESGDHNRNDDDDDSFQFETVPGVVNARVVSTAGQVRSSIHLIDGQELVLTSHSVTGGVESRISDNYLGHFSLKSSLGSTDVMEKTGSASMIKYEKNLRHVKTGVKFIDDSEENQNNISDISLSSGTSRVSLTFV